jgi:uncharacterized protein (TIGR03067 family)
MTARLCVLLPLLLAAPLAADEKKAADKDLEALEGKWVFETLVVGGVDEYKDGAPKVVIQFKGGKGEFVEGNVVPDYRTFKFKIDPTTDPKCLDVTFIDKGETMEAIYELKGDELKICVHAGGKERPTKFESPEGSPLVLAVAKRQKP